MSNERLLAPIGSSMGLHKVLTDHKGTAKDPTVTFSEDQSSGWFLSDKGEITLTTGGTANIIQNKDYTEFSKPIILDDSDEVELDPGMGLLFKRHGEEGLWWKTNKIEVNLTNGGVPDPLMLSSGLPFTPSFSFTSAPNTGMFLQKDNMLGFTVDGLERFRLGQKVNRTIQPLEFMDSLPSIPTVQTLGRLYKKANSDGLWWNTIEGGEVNLAAKLVDTIVQASGSAVAPAYSFGADKNTGMFLKSAGALSMSVSSNEKLCVKVAEITTAVPLHSQINGSAVAPVYSFGNDNNTGLYLTAQRKLGASVGGVQVLDLDAANVSLTSANASLLVQSGTIAKLGIGFVGDTGTGFYKPAVGDLSFVSKGIEKLKISNTVDISAAIKTVNGTAVEPAYGFLNGKSGLYYEDKTAHGMIGLSLNGVGYVQLKNECLGVDKQIRVSNNLDNKLPQYSFKDFSDRGMYHTFQGVGLTFGDGKTYLDISDQMVSINKPLELIDEKNESGVLYKKAGNIGLWWKPTNGEEVNLLTSQSGGSFAPNLDEITESIDKIIRINAGKAVNQAVDRSVNVAVRTAVAESVDVAVSAAVSASVGNAVNAAVNTAVSAAVDASVNTAVNSIASKAVNSIVVDAVNAAVDSTVEQMVTDVINNTVNRVVNSTVSSVVGFAVDKAIADAVGNAVDDAIAASVDKAVDTSVNAVAAKTVNDAINKTLMPAVNTAVSAAVGVAVNTAVDKSVGVAVDKAVAASVSTAVSISVNETVNRVVSANVGAAVNTAVAGAVGDAVGVAVDNAINSKLTVAVNSVNNTVEKALGSVNNMVTTAINTALNTTVYPTVNDMVSKTVGNLIDMSVHDAVSLVVGGIAIDAVNTAVSDRVDTAVNDAVNSSMTTIILPSVDSLVKSSVDKAISDAVNTTVSAAIDKAVSETVDTSVSHTIKAAVNTAVSTTVAATVNDAINNTVASTVDKAVTGAVNAALSNTVDKVITDAVELAVNSTVDTAVYNAINIAVNSMASEAVNSAVNDTVNNAVNNAVSDTVDRVIGSAVDRAVAEIQSSASVNQKPSFPMLADVGGVAAPTYSFVGDASSGMYKVAGGVVGIAAGGTLGLSVDNDSTTIYNTLVVKDSHGSSPAVGVEGHLYKKPNDEGLYWSTVDDEVDLTQTRYPLDGLDGSADAPTYGFINELGTGLFRLSSGGMGVSVGNNTLAYYSPLVAGFNKPLELNEVNSINASLVPSSTSVGKLYKKTGDNGLYWNTTNGEINLVHRDKLSVGDGSLYVVDGNLHWKVGDVDKELVGSVNGVVSGVVGGLIDTAEDTKAVIDETDGISALSSISMNIGTAEKLKIDDSGVKCLGSLSIQNTEILVGNKLTTRTHGVRRTYNSSESFTASGVVHAGSVVGVLADGTVNCVSGGKWDGNVLLSNITTGTMSNCILLDEDIILRTYECLKGGSSVLTLSAAYIDSNNKLTSVVEMDISSIESSEVLNHTVVLLKVNHMKYVMLYGIYGEADVITVKKINLSESNKVNNAGAHIGSLLDINVESTLLYTTNQSVETFDAVYENSGSLDILVLCMYSLGTRNFDTALFSVNPETNHDVVLGHVSLSISMDSVIGNNKTLKTLLLPGQIVVISYGNTKTFILLPSVYTSAPSAGDTLADSDSSDCIDMIYDTVNGVIISVEKTITDTCFLQVLDIFSTKIEVLKSKKLGNNTIIPLCISYNTISSNFILFYSDAVADGNVKAQVFTHDGELINMHSIYSNVGHAYAPMFAAKGSMVHMYGKCVSQTDKAFVIGYLCGTNGVALAAFDDNYGIQPNAFVGIANNNALTGESCEVIIKGQIYNGGSVNLPSGYVGKKLYLDSNGSTNAYPTNLTSTATGNVFIGTCLSVKHILIGL